MPTTTIEDVHVWSLVCRNIWKIFLKQGRYEDAKKYADVSLCIKLPIALYIIITIVSSNQHSTKQSSK